MRPEAYVHACMPGPFARDELFIDANLRTCTRFCMCDCERSVYIYIDDLYMIFLAMYMVHTVIVHAVFNIYIAKTLTKQPPVFHYAPEYIPHLCGGWCSGGDSIIHGQMYGKQVLLTMLSKP